MPNSSRAHSVPLYHPPLLLIVLLSLASATGCSGLFGARKKVQVAALLAPLREANTAQLINEVNRFAGVRSIHGKLDIQFEDTSFAETGIIEKYRKADANITLQRPGSVYLVIQFAFVDLAQMTSDGEHFRVAVLRGDDKYRRFVKGTNDAVYPNLDGDDESEGDRKTKQMGEKETVNALSNLRPQHLTDALMIRPISKTTDDLTYSQSEFYQDEPDSRAEAKKGTRVIRGYYVLEEFSVAASESKLLRRFWFDRVNGIRLARLQTFDDRGLLITDVGFFDERPFGDGGSERLPSRIEITRPHDHYKLSLSYQDPGSVVLDRDWPPGAFVLQNKWGLPEVDLDARRKTSNP